MTTSPLAGDSQIANALTTLGTTALGSTRNELLTQLIVAAANATGGGSGGAAWGGITGTLSAQTDLQTALDAKLALAGGTMTGALLNSTNGAASTPSLLLSGTPFTGGSGTTTKPLVNIETAGATSTGWSTSGTMLGVNAPSGFAGNLADWQINGASVAYVYSGGLVSSVVSAVGNLSLGAQLGSGGAYVTLSSNNPSAGRWTYMDSEIYMSGGYGAKFANARNDAPNCGIKWGAAGVVKITDASTGRGTLDAAGYQVGGVAGANFGPGPATSITVVNGIITAIS